MWSPSLTIVFLHGYGYDSYGYDGHTHHCSLHLMVENSPKNEIGSQHIRSLFVSIRLVPVAKLAVRHVQLAERLASFMSSKKNTSKKKMGSSERGRKRRGTSIDAYLH